MQVCLLLSLVLLSVQAISPQSDSLCFYGGELILDELSTIRDWQCAFGNIRVSSFVKEGSVVCRYPVLRSQKVQVTVYAGSERYDLGVYPVQNCVKVSSSEGCPGDYPEVTLELENIQAAQNEYFCVWNGASIEVSAEEKTISCSVPYNLATPEWELVLKTRDRRGYIGESSVLIRYKYLECPDQIPIILSAPQTSSPWTQDIRLSTSVNQLTRDVDSVPWCKFNFSTNLIHTEEGSFVGDEMVCPMIVLPPGKALLQVSRDGRTWSEPQVLEIQSGIVDFSPKSVCFRTPGQIVTLVADSPLDPELQYICYFGSLRAIAQVAPDLSSLQCDTPPQIRSGRLALLIHDTKQNHAATFSIGEITSNC